MNYGDAHDAAGDGGYAGIAMETLMTLSGQAVAGSTDAGLGSRTGAAVQRCLDAALAYLHREQQEGTHWAGTLSSSALATAICLVALHVLDQARYREPIRRGRRWLFATQHDDGGWGDAVVDPSNINATSLALGALTFTMDANGGADERDALRRARACLERFGGFAAVGDPARCTLSGPCRTVAALAGLMQWRRIKRLRPEVILLPRRLRRTISTTFPAYLSIATLHSAMAPHPLNWLPTYGLARSRATAWLRQAQGPDGSFEESAFLSAVIVACLVAAGRRDLPWLSGAAGFILKSQRDDGSWPIDRDLETFDTAMTVQALDEAGVPVPHGDRVRAWLLARQFDRTCFPTGARPGGWAWAMPSGWPECDDTAYTILALRALGVAPSARPIRRGAQWLEEMQNADGSWSTFVRNSSMPFDHDCPYITGHVLCALQAAGRLSPGSVVLGRALAYIARAQRYDGSFASIWFRQATAGTASVLEALAACGLLHTPLAQRARDALLRGQNDDGGWAGLRGQDSTAEETSWALLALMRWPPDGVLRRAVERGVAWLTARQQPDGTWVPAPIGLYYSAMWYSDSYFAVTLPVQALARAKVYHATA
ncbi:MAG TPA: prenyltransferase/squalene oxidase repeat-containing protein [Chloroflexota bacterium]|nr:prenyltransferase/squalene oxidase repeat-containing protein [Chloroflexota bacterium]